MKTRDIIQETWTVGAMGVDHPCPPSQGIGGPSHCSLFQIVTMDQKDHSKVAAAAPEALRLLIDASKSPKCFSCGAQGPSPTDAAHHHPTCRLLGFLGSLDLP
jgi:hypothetical protein